MQISAALHEVVRQLHHLDEAVVHHRKASVGAEHAQAVRHVVERGIELMGQRRLAEARGQRLDEDRMQAEVDALQAEEEQHEQDRQADVVEVAMQRQRDRHRSAGDQHVELEQPRPTVVAGRAAGRVADRHRDAEHMGNRIVAAEDGNEAPGAEHHGVDNRTDRVARRPDSGFLIGQPAALPLVVLAHPDRARGADGDDQEGERPQQRIAGLERGHHGG
ncbi:hypothetical protein ACVILL_001486 [Bradyrhizobium sp. USDA 3364]